MDEKSPKTSEIMDTDEKEPKENVPFFKTGAEKITAELGELIKTVNDPFECVKNDYKKLLKIIVDRCENHPAFDALILQEHKSWGRCMAYCEKKIRKLTTPTEEQKRLAAARIQPIGVPVSANLLLSFIDEYYKLDDKKEVEKEKEAERKRKEQSKKLHKSIEERKAKARETAKTKETKINNVPTAAPQAQKPVQLSLFDILEGGM